jgi:hypothetical protein
MNRVNNIFNYKKKKNNKIGFIEYLKRKFEDENFFDPIIQKIYIYNLF